MIAARQTKVAAGATDTQIDSGNAIHVYGVHVSNTGGATAQVLVEQADGTTSIMDIDVLAGSSHTVDVKWIADQGVAITTPADVTCTVFHTQAGR